VLDGRLRDLLGLVFSGVEQLTGVQTDDVVVVVQRRLGGKGSS